MKGNPETGGPKLTFNGINGASGGYLLPSITPQELAAIALGERPDQSHIRELESRHRWSGRRARALQEGLDPKDLGQAGWGVIFAHDDREGLPEVREALGELLTHRKAQAGDCYQEFSGVDAYRPGESKSRFLARHGSGPGPVDPARVPYYLLIVGDPQTIPFEFQYQLDVQHAVGRLHFDQLEDYAAYARSVVEAENRAIELDRKAGFFGVQNPDDPATRLSATQLVGPLADWFAVEPLAKDWQVDVCLGAPASKAALTERLGGAHTASFLFTASHGMGFPSRDPRQLPHQGALLCQDWPGPSAWRGTIPEEHYFAADDLPSTARMNGLLAFHFACYSVGTPCPGDFAQQVYGESAMTAQQPFISRLPQRLLAMPGGGALAVIGHIDRAWGYSFRWEGAGAQLTVFQSTLRHLLTGHPVGSALEYFNQRYAELSTILTEELRGMQFGKRVEELELAGMWTANNDARNYVILGDPAVRLVSLSSKSEPQRR